QFGGFENWETNFAEAERAKNRVGRFFDVIPKRSLSGQQIPHALDSLKFARLGRRLRLLSGCGTFTHSRLPHDKYSCIPRSAWRNRQSQRDPIPSTIASPLRARPL